MSLICKADFLSFMYQFRSYTPFNFFVIKTKVRLQQSKWSNLTKRFRSSDPFLLNIYFLIYFENVFLIFLYINICKVTNLCWERRRKFKAYMETIDRHNLRSVMNSIGINFHSRLLKTNFIYTYELQVKWI